MKHVGDPVDAPLGTFPANFLDPTRSLWTDWTAMASGWTELGRIGTPWWLYASQSFLQMRQMYCGIERDFTTIECVVIVVRNHDNVGRLLWLLWESKVGFPVRILKVDQLVSETIYAIEYFSSFLDNVENVTLWYSDNWRGVDFLIHFDIHVILFIKM
jgi:hypothetical protein